MADYLIKGETLSTIANGVRNVSGVNKELTPSSMAEIMSSYEGSGGGAGVETSKVTVAASTYPTDVWYSPTLGEVARWSADEPGAYAQFECVKGTIIMVDCYMITNRTFVGCEYVDNKIVLVTESVARIE